MRLRTLAAMLAGVLCLAAAADPADRLPDPAQEARARALFADVRCLVCQNESLAGSRAELAQDLRREIRGLIKLGKTDPQIMEFLVSRYGDFVRYRPPLKPSTWLLWGGPFVLAGAGLAGLLMFLRRRRVADATLSTEEQREAAALLAGDR